MQLGVKLVAGLIGFVFAFSLVSIVGIVFGAEFKPYGSIAQEDELSTYYKGEYWVNTGTMLGIGNGQFMATGLQGSYSIDEAIDEFGIYEDTETFIIEPKYKGKYSDVLFVYEIDGYDFEISDIYEDESDIDKYLTEWENNQ